MQIRYGGERRVFIFKNIVVKMPYTFKGWLSNINELYNWHKYKELKYFMCLLYFMIYSEFS